MCLDLFCKPIIHRMRRFAVYFPVIFLLSIQDVNAATETFTSGAFIINMGVTPQTVANGLKPYGLIYDLIRNNDVPVKWVIGQGKVKDGIDFTYNGIAYRGGTFVINAEYRTAAVNAKIAAWQAKGVVGVTTTTSMTLDVTMILQAVPNWAMDAANGNIAIKFLQAAEIPASAYYFRTPATLNACDNLYVMPHADPKWSTHSNLYFWNKNSRGAIWGGCHAVSVMEGPTCVNPGNPSQNLKFLTTGGMVQFGSHADGTPPYSYSNISDPAFQMMGLEDAAHENGSEQIYLPLKAGSTWNPSVKIGCYDPTHSDIPGKSNGPAAVVAYGYAFNDTTRGMVMYEAGHNIGGTDPENVAAQRIFFNWSFLGSSNKEPRVTYSNIPTKMNSSVMYPNFTATATSPVGLSVFTYQWSSTIGGVFSAPTSSVTDYTAPAVGAPTVAKIICKVTDNCGRYALTEFSVTFMPPPAPPVAVNDTIKYTSLCNATTKTINVLTNDNDINLDIDPSITFLGGGNYGTFTNNGNGSVTYTPGWLFQGTDTMRYQVCDSTALCHQATIVVTTNYSGSCALTTYLRTDTARADTVQLQQSIATATDALGSPDAVDGNNANTAQFNNDNDSLILRLDHQISTGDTVQFRMAPDNNNCIDFTIMGALTSGGFVPGVNSLNGTIPINTSKVNNWYNLIVTGNTRYVKILVRNTACDNKINLDAVRANYRYCTSNVPVATKDYATTAANVAITTNVKTNDTDPAGGALTVSIVDNPNHGSAGVNGAGNIVYTPDSAFSGADTLIYKICNSTCLCDTAFVIYNVQTHPPCGAGVPSYYRNGNATAVTSSVNTTTTTEALGIPDAVDGSNALIAKINNAIGAELVLDLTDTVYANDTIVIRMSSDNNSAVTITVEGNLTNAWGSPSTTTNFNLPAGSNKIYLNYNFILNADTRYIRFYQSTSAAKVDVDALSYDYWYCGVIPNRPPVANNDTISTFVNRPVYQNVKANDSDPDNNPITHTIISPAAAHGSASVSGTGILYTPDFGYIGMDTVTYQLCDNGSPNLCDTAILIITSIKPGPPVAIVDSSTVNSNAVVNINVQANDTLAVTSYSYTTSLLPAILPPTNGTAILVGNNIQYTPNANFTGTDSLVYQICDNGDPVQCDTAFVYITVTNLSPVANDDNATTSACNAVIINANSNDTDPESGILTISSVSTPANGTAVISNNQIVYTPTQSPVFTGNDEFYYFVCDNGSPSKCDSATVRVTVNVVTPPNTAPTAVDDIDSTYINQDVYVLVLANDSDPEGDSLRIDTNAVGLLMPLHGTRHYLPGSQILYVPNTGIALPDSFEYKVCDVHNNAAGCINIVDACSIAMAYVNTYNRRPASNDNYAYTINTSAISNQVGQNDYEPDGQVMTYTALNGPSFGGIVFNSDGTYTYTPDGFSTGLITIDYIVCDDAAVSLCDTSTLYITVDITNVPPIPEQDTVICAGITPTPGDVSANDMDPNGNIDPSGFTILSGPNHGNVVWNNDGTFTFTADTGFFGIDYIFYEVCDLGSPALCSNSLLALIVNKVPPVPVNEYESVWEDSVLTVPAVTGILSNGDFDPNGLSLYVDNSLVLNPVHGNAVVWGDGRFTYTPFAGYNGPDFFIVDVCDDSSSLASICTPDTIFITVDPFNDPPILDNENLSINEDTPYNGDLTDAGDSDPDTTALTANTTPLVDVTNGVLLVNADGTYTYTPNGNYTGSDLAVIEICDAGTPMPSICTNDTIFITVNPVNDPPVVDNESLTTDEDTPVNGDLTDAGDSDPDGTALSANTVPVVDAVNGSVVINSDGTFTYTPDPDFNGTDLVVVSICDAGTPMPASCVNDTIFITVTAVNDTPVVDNEIILVDENTVYNGDLTDAGDSDPDTTVLSANTTPVVDVANGILVVNANGTYSYTPNPNYNGPDTAVITICDAGNPMPAICINDTLFITVAPFNDPPVLDNENISTNEDTPVNGDLTDAGDYDPDTTALTANTVPVLAPAHGNIIINADGTFTYTPDADYNGTDIVVVNICDGGTPAPDSCRNDTIFITVNPVNDAPVVINDTVSTPEDIAFTDDLFDGGDYDPDTTSLIPDTIPVLAPAHGTVSIGLNGIYLYTPDPFYNGSDMFIVNICDSGRPLPAICRNDTVYISIFPTNNPPVLDNEIISTNEDTPVNGDLTDAGDTDPDSTALTANTVPVLDASNGSIVINANGTYTYTPDPDFNGTDIVVVSVCDAGTPMPAECTNDTIFITVNPGNDPPVLDNETISTNEDIPVNGDLTDGGDADPDSTILTANTVPVLDAANGSIIINADGTYTYTPDPDFNGTDMVVVSICDAGTPMPAACINDTIFITVNPLNDPPVLDNETISTNEDTPFNGDLTDAGDADPDSTALTANTVPVLDASNGSIVINANGTYTYTPDPDFNGTDMVVVSICDAGTPMPSACTNDTIFITVDPVNDPPVLDNEIISTNEDTPVNGDLTDAGDSDIDTTALTANTVPVLDATNGSIIINADGTYTYTPDPDFNGTDIVVVSICDTGTPMPAACTNDTIFITVNPLNDAPVLDNETVSTNEDTPFNGDLTDAGDTDPDSTALTANTVPVLDASNGSIVINANGTYTYTPDPDFNGTDMVVVSICDAGTPMPSACTNDTIFITVDPVNDAPVVINDTLNSIEDSTFTGTVINPNDFDPDTTALSADTVPVLNPAHGSITVSTNGTYSYTPDPNYYGTDTAVISVCDSGTPLPPICVNDTLFIFVAQFNEPPVIANDTITTNEDIVFNGTIITAGDYDPDSLALVVTTAPVLAASNGVIVMNANGTYSYTPATNFNSSDIAVYEICDTSVPFPECVNDTLVITVAAVNDTSVIANDAASTNEDVPLSSTILTAGDFDADTTALTVNTVPVSGPSNGLIVMNGDGTYTYTPNSDFNGVDVIVFNVCDAGTPLPSICVNDTLTITVNAVNDTMIVANDTISTNEDIPVNGSVIDSGDIDPDSTTITANPVPVSGPSNGNIIININGTYTYTPDPDFNGSDTVIISICDSGTPLPSICMNDTLIITVNAVNDNPVAVSENAGVCSGSSVQASVLTNDSDIDADSIFVSSIVQPQNGSAITDGITITYTPNPGYHGADTVDYTICDNGSPQGCSNASLIISVNGPIASGILAHEVLCFGGSTGSVTTSAFLVPTFTYLWNTGATTANITNVPAGLYSVTITDSLGCSIIDTATVLEPPALVLSSTITDVLCFGNTTGSIQLGVTGGTASFSFLWNNGDTNQDLLNVPAGTYDVTVTDNNGCTSTHSATITQPASALSASASITPSTCLVNVQGSVDVTVAGGTSGYTYAWDSGQTTEDITAVAGTYTLVVTDNNSCTDTSVYTISDNSSLSIATYDSLSFCQGDSARLSSVIQSGPFQWMSNGIAIPGATDSIYIASQTATYTLEINNGCGIFTSNGINIVANPMPVIDASGGTAICEGSNTQLTAAGANSYVWTPSSGLNDVTLSNPTASPVVTTDYTVTGFIGGCSSDTVLTILVHPAPVVNITSTPFTCETGTQLMANAITSGTGTYLWTPSYGLDSVNIATPVATPSTTTNYQVTVTDSFSCVSTAAILIAANCDTLKIPNGITPEGDGVNDAFEILGLNKFPNNSLQIFNRWGNLVYHSKPYNNDWKGTCTEKNVLEGETLPDGTYYYILELGNGAKNKTGFVEIRR